MRKLGGLALQVGWRPLALYPVCCQAEVTALGLQAGSDRRRDVHIPPQHLAHLCRFVVPSAYLCVPYPNLAQPSLPLVVRGAQLCLPHPSLAQPSLPFVVCGGQLCVLYPNLAQQSVLLPFVVCGVPPCTG